MIQVKAEWGERYGRRFDSYRLPKTKEKRQALAESIGVDGYHLLQMIAAEGVPDEVKTLTLVDIMCQIWLQ